MKTDTPERLAAAILKYNGGSIAERIADVYGDGQTWETANGVNIDSVCRELATDSDHLDRDADAHRYDFADGSAIVTWVGAWDVSIVGANCHCMAGAGHHPECPHAED